MKCHPIVHILLIVFVIYCLTAAIWRLQVEWPTDYEETRVQCKDIGGQRCYMEPALISGEVQKERELDEGHSARTLGKIRDTSSDF